MPKVPQGGISEHAVPNESEHRASLETGNVDAESVETRRGRSLDGNRATTAPARATGVLVRGCEQRIDALNTGSPRQWGARAQLEIREDRSRLARVAERSVAATNRLTIEEQRDLSSRSTQKQQEPGRLT